jgi:hypothetical protein
MQMVASALLERPEYRGRMFDGRGYVPELEVRSMGERERERERGFVSGAE